VPYQLYLGVVHPALQVLEFFFHDKGQPDATPSVISIWLLASLTI
jgi:hypothetical protein